LRETRTIPIVFTVVADPIGSGFVASLARPGGNTTGFVVMEGSFGGKWLELLKEIAPRVVGVAVLFNPLFVLPDPFTNAYRVEITSLAARYRLPAVYAFRSFAELGGLLSYGNDLNDNFRRAAIYADRILKGDKPGELPVQAPVKFELVINLKTAKALGLDVPLFLQQLADEVIE
jgi:putative tryptophan/tyrosine transport system substrate-binding protein